ncbi:hypothetical protein [Marinactinospora rubrisoli]|uniref:Uncharacterized protein n=1 Tax=Marinactinospora rubrisoli TaxID=2715399 RepID=A0ABW2KFI4_9ACTN
MGENPQRDLAMPPTPHSAHCRCCPSLAVSRDAQHLAILLCRMLAHPAGTDEAVRVLAEANIAHPGLIAAVTTAVDYRQLPDPRAAEGVAELRFIARRLRRRTGDVPYEKLSSYVQGAPSAGSLHGVTNPGKDARKLPSWKTLEGFVTACLIALLLDAHGPAGRAYIAQWKAAWIAIGDTTDSRR